MLGIDKKVKKRQNIQNIKDELDNLHIVYSIDIELEKDVKSFVESRKSPIFAVEKTMKLSY